MLVEDGREVLAIPVETLREVPIKKVNFFSERWRDAWVFDQVAIERGAPASLCSNDDKIRQQAQWRGQCSRSLQGQFQQRREVSRLNEPLHVFTRADCAKSLFFPAKVPL